jgi:hypothetical protein
MIRKSGRCLCGKVTFEAEFADTTYGACHCGMCRRWAGGPLFAKHADRLTVTSGEDFTSSYKTSDWATRVHCRRCGSNLWYNLEPARIQIVSVGALDDQSDMVLTEEIYIDCKPDGYAFAGETRKLTEAEVVAAYAPAGEG